MRVYAQPKPRRKKKGITGFLLIVFIIPAFFLIFDYFTRTAIENVIAYHTKVFASRLINETMIEQMERSDIGYDKLIHITRGSAGGVNSIEADMIQINKLKSGMGRSVVEKLEDGGRRTITVPLGTIIGTQLTSGRGPGIPIEIIPVGYVQSEIYNSFTAAGINQTQHQIMLCIQVQMIAILPGYSVKTDTETNFCIAETIIVGDIPQGYASIGSNAATFLPIEKHL